MKDSTDVAVYGLYQWPSNRPFYVGCTTRPSRRLWAHRAAAAGRRKDSLSRCTVKPDEISMRILARCDDRGHAETIERALQSHLGVNGRLRGSTPGP